MTRSSGQVVIKIKKITRFVNQFVDQNALILINIYIVIYYLVI